MKDGGHHYFIKYLEAAEPGVGPTSRALAAFVLAAICDGHARGRQLCAEQGLLGRLLSLLAGMVRPRRNVLAPARALCCPGQACRRQLSAVFLHRGSD